MKPKPLTLPEVFAKLDDSLARAEALHGRRRVERARHVVVQALAARVYEAACEDLAKKRAALESAAAAFYAAKDTADGWGRYLDELRSGADESRRDAQLAHRAMFKTTVVHVYDRARGEVRAMPITFRKETDADDF